MNELAPNRNKIRFRFKWLNRQSREVGYRKHTGFVDQSRLNLHTLEFPVEVLSEVSIEGQDIRFAAATDETERIDLSCRIWGATAREIKSVIDRPISRQMADSHRQSCEQDERLDECRILPCPACGCSLILTGIPESPQVFCDYCQTLSDIGEPPEDVPSDTKFGICDECQMFSEPKRFLLFYFYFLIADYGLHWTRSWRCSACMRPEAWRMLVVNAPFLVGLPLSLVQLYRSYANSWSRGVFRGLDSANRDAKRGEFDKAIANYLMIVDQVPCCAGVKTNLANGLLARGEIENAERVFRDALIDCANYTPALHGLACCEKRRETSSMDLEPAH